MIISVKPKCGFRSVNPVVLFVCKIKRPMVSVIRKDRGSHLAPDNAIGSFILTP